MIFRLENFSDEQYEAAVQQTAVMVKTIPGIISASFAANETSLYDTYRPHTQGFTHTLIVTLVDAQALKGYDTAPTHLEFGKMIIPFMKEAICTDTLIDTYPDEEKP